MSLKQTIISQFCSNSHYDNIISIEPQYPVSLNETQLKDFLAAIPTLSPNTLIVINDADRSTPSFRIIRLLRQLKKIINPMQFIIASGAHKPITKESAKLLSGAKDEDKLWIHNGMDENNMIYLGETSRGTEIEINPVLYEADQVFTINGVEPHYFAGFTGGVKSLIPGLAAKKTIALNHRWALSPDAQIMRTEENPIFEDLWEAAGMLRPLDEVQSVQIVNHGNQIHSIQTGALRTAFDLACIKSRQIYGFNFSHPIQRIISFVQGPLDKTLYQAQKAMENVKKILQDGGSFVLVAKCEKGIGPSAFFQRMQALGTPENVINSISFENYQFGDHKAFYWAQMANRAELFYVGNLSSDIITEAFMRKITQEELLEKIKVWSMAGDKILIDFAGGFSAAELQGNIA
jgi:nickel-dependent lactate racemase